MLLHRSSILDDNKKDTLVRHFLILFLSLFLCTHCYVIFRSTFFFRGSTICCRYMLARFQHADAWSQVCPSWQQKSMSPRGRYFRGPGPLTLIEWEFVMQRDCMVHIVDIFLALQAISREQLTSLIDIFDALFVSTMLDEKILIVVFGLYCMSLLIFWHQRLITDIIGQNLNHSRFHALLYSVCVCRYNVYIRFVSNPSTSVSRI